MIWTSIRNVLIALVGAVVPSLLFAHFAPRPYLKGYTDKLAAFVEDPEGFDVIAIGSSRMERGFVPKVFDGAMRSRGIEVRSFNFGLSGSSEHEWNVLLPEIIAHAKRPLKWVIAELQPTQENYDGWQVTHRLTHWHTPIETWRVFKSVALADLPFDKRFELYQTHLEYALMHNFNMGRGPGLFGEWFGPMRALQAEPNRGWKPTTKARESIEVRQKSFQKKLKTFNSRELRTSGVKQPATRELVLPELVDEKLKRIEAFGAKAVFIALMPLTSAPSFEDRNDLMVLEYNNPSRLPHFFVPQHFFDSQHLSTAGAQAFTRMLARDL